jgi:hypothetical protein
MTGILDNVDDELLDLKRVAVQGWPALVQAQLARDAHGIEVAAHEPRDLHGELLQIERLDCGRLPARLRPKACHQGESGIDHGHIPLRWTGSPAAAAADHDRASARPFLREAGWPANG